MIILISIIPAPPQRISTLIWRRIRKQPVFYQTWNKLIGLRPPHGFLLINARSLAPKLDELEILLHESSADVAAVSETWLYKDIDSKYLKIQGFNLFRRDRLNGRESGVCVYVSNAIPSKRCNNLASEAFECLWLLSRPYRLPRNITGIIPGILYKPPDKCS